MLVAIRESQCAAFCFVLELFLPLQCFDEGFLGEILGIGDIAHHAVDLHEDAPQVVRDKPVLSFDSLERRGYSSLMTWQYTIPVPTIG